MADFAIELDAVTKKFGDSQALRGVTFSTPVGSVLGVLGPNGAGKTTTINILSTLIRPSTGRALVAGYDVVKQAKQVRASVGVTGQYAAVDELLTGRENLILFARLRGLKRRDADARADEMLEAFSLIDAGGRRVSTYSGGMRRRVDIACGLVVPPKVVFLDEPTTGLDPRSRREVWELVASLKDQGITVLLTTQYLEEADALSDSIVVIDHGKVIADGTPEELKRRVGGSYCQVTPADPADVPAIAAALEGIEGLETDTDSGRVAVPAPDGVTTLSEVFRRVGALGVELNDISLRKPSLDEVFFKLTGAAEDALA
ncbi:ATP-binding cassette domain-containing protein [Mycolicibacterium sp. P9-64]|uniref:ATP-binding cassette domain-containing protein n=1 Tax=Mycolicibacterium sp. P9-64 TaxID=2024612 RepID=UPI0011ED97B5|nr:ATP-binding cassette domain-containing protein [Mycolicibacterium sp. P9-64]KAA0086949.1 ATP-binding cassette domain-containing protein [Mycolicibacterium sp. P9-64]